MTGAVVVGNLLYVAGAITLAAVLSSVVVLRHRKPKSVEANVATFNRGLQALAPDNQRPARRPVASAARRGGRPNRPKPHVAAHPPGTGSRRKSEAETG